MNDEEGLYFVGLANKASSIVDIVKQQLGVFRTMPDTHIDPDERDRKKNTLIFDSLLSHVASDIGALLYVPSLKNLEHEHEFDFIRTKESFDDVIKHIQTHFSKIPLKLFEGQD
jgi:hypothetical protein